MRTLDQSNDYAGATACLSEDLYAAASTSVAPRSKLDAVALRAATANGFGAVDLAADAPGEPVPTNFGQRVRDRTMALLQHWRDARRARAERFALAQLDSATLRDLGLEAADPQRLYAALGHEVAS